MCWHSGFASLKSMVCQLARRVLVMPPRSRSTPPFSGSRRDARVGAVHADITGGLPAEEEWGR